MSDMPGNGAPAAPANFAAELAAAKAELAAPVPAAAEGGGTPDPKAPASTPPSSSSAADPAAAKEADTGSAPPAESATPTDASSPSSDAAAKPPDSLAKRLALLAAGDRKLREDTKAFEARESARRPDLERLEKIRKAPSKLDAIRELFDGDDEAVSELFIELDTHIRQKDAPLTAEQKLEQLVEKKLADRDTKRKAEADGHLQQQRDGYVKSAMDLLEQRADDFPLTSLGVQASDITAIFEGVHEASGKALAPEQVLRAIEEAREDALKKRRKPEQRPVATPSGAAETGANNQTSPPIRRNDAPVTPPRPKSFDEELEDAKRELKGGH
jgi:hypothetical protein